MLDRLDLMLEHAREVETLPAEWRVFQWESLPRGRSTSKVYQLTGAVAPLYVRGPKKGRRNWRRMKKATEQAVILTIAEHDAWLLRWEERTGVCFECQGRGQELARAWIDDDHQPRTEWRPCRRCKGVTGQLTDYGDQQKLPGLIPPGP